MALAMSLCVMNGGCNALYMACFVMDEPEKQKT